MAYDLDSEYVKSLSDVDSLRAMAESLEKLTADSLGGRTQYTGFSVRLSDCGAYVSVTCRKTRYISTKVRD